MKVEVQSPTRVDLAGGTLDLWPLYSFLGPCKTINVAVDIYTYVTVEESDDFSVELKDRNFSTQFSSLKELMQSSDPELNFIKSHLKFWQPQQGVAIRIHSESPVGGGLGGSSSITMGLTKAFCEIFQRDMAISEMVQLASNIEAHILNTPTGTQDYYPPALGGIHCLTFAFDQVRIEQISMDMQELNNRSFLVYTGEPHHSGLNNWEILKNAVEQNMDTLNALSELQNIADNMYHNCVKQDWDAMQGCFHREFEARLKLSQSYVSESIQNLRNLVLQNGAQEIKICGAGGGGCVLVWCPQDKKEEVQQICQSKKYQVLPAQAVKKGFQIKKS